MTFPYKYPYPGQNANCRIVLVANTIKVVAELMSRFAFAFLWPREVGGRKTPSLSQPLIKAATKHWTNLDSLSCGTYVAPP